MSPTGGNWDDAFGRCDAFPNDEWSFAGSLAANMPLAALAPLAEVELLLALGVRCTEFTTQRRSGLGAPVARVEGVDVHREVDAGLLRHPSKAPS